MTAFRDNHYLTDQEWLEMAELKKQIESDFTTRRTEELERFSELFSRSILGKGDCRNHNIEKAS